MRYTCRQFIRQNLLASGAFLLHSVAMRKSGFTEEDITQLMMINPSRAFALRSL
jgi:predicted metal-dependent phosphotriesterase family hydrolase